MKATFDDLLDLLRTCPAEQLPATPESATAPDPPPNDSSIDNRQSTIDNPNSSFSLNGYAKEKWRKSGKSGDSNQLLLLACEGRKPLSATTCSAII